MGLEHPRIADSGLRPGKTIDRFTLLNNTTVGRLRMPKRATISCSDVAVDLASSNSP